MSEIEGIAPPVAERDQVDARVKQMDEENPSPELIPPAESDSENQSSGSEDLPADSAADHQQPEAGDPPLVNTVGGPDTRGDQGGGVKPDLDAQEVGGFESKEELVPFWVKTKGIIEAGLREGVFTDEHEIAIAKKALEDPDDIRSNLTALKRCGEFDGNDSIVNEKINALLKKFKASFVVSDGKSLKTIAELEVERLSADPERAQEINALLENGELKLRIGKSAEEHEDAQEDPDSREKLDGKSQNPVDGDSSEVVGSTTITAMDKMIEVQLKDVDKRLRGDSLSEEDRSDLRKLKSDLERSKKDESKNSKVLKIAALRGIRNRMITGGEDTTEIDGLLKGASIIEEEAIGRIGEHLVKSMNSEGIVTAKDMLRDGRVEDFLNFTKSHMDDVLAEIIFDRKFKNSQEARDYVDAILEDPARLDELKKRAGQLGILAALIMIGSGMVGSVTKDAMGSVDK